MQVLSHFPRFQAVGGLKSANPGVPGLFAGKDYVVFGRARTEEDAQLLLRQALEMANEGLAHLADETVLAWRQKPEEAALQPGLAAEMYEESLPLFLLALSTYEKLGKTRTFNYAFGSMSLGQAQLALGNVDEAIEWLEKGYRQFADLYRKAVRLSTDEIKKDPDLMPVGIACKLMADKPGSATLRGLAWACGTELLALLERVNEFDKRLPSLRDSSESFQQRAATRREQRRGGAYLCT